MRRKLRYLALAALTAFLMGGCQSGPTRPEPTSLLKLGFALESHDLASLVNSVTLTIRYSPVDSVVENLTLIDGVVSDTVMIQAADDVVFVLRAFSENGTLLYVGEETKTVPPGGEVVVDILLTPPPDLLMLRAGPIFQAVGVAGQPVEVFVDVYNVPDLFGATFRLRFDTSVVQYQRFIPGDFLDADSVETLPIAFPDSSGTVAFSITRLRDKETGILPPGVSGTGRLATFVFSLVRPGSASITFLEGTRIGPRLFGPGGQVVEGFNNLVLEPATVEVTAGG